MSDPDRMAMWPVGLGDDFSERLWANDGLLSEPEGNQPGDPMDRLVSLGFIMGALRRRWRVWCALTVLGLVIGAGFYHVKPPLYQAATTLVLNDGTDTDGSTAIATDAALAQSTAVAEAVIKQLKLPGTVTTFLGSYVVTTPSDQVLVITASAPTSAEAVQRAAAIATQYLALRVTYADLQQQQLETSLDQQLQLTQQDYNLATDQVNKVTAEPSSSAQQKQLAALQEQQQQDSASLTEAEENVEGTLITSRAATQAEIKDSQVINSAAPLKSSKVKALLLDVGGGLFGGLVLGIAIVVVAALMSNRLRRRDDVAYALGAPVKLSVGTLRTGRLPRIRRDSGQRRRDMDRLVKHLRKTIPAANAGTSALAVIAVDDARTVANSVVSLAVNSVRQGQRVLLADLSQGRDAARLLGLSQRGLGEVGFQGARFTVVVPATDDLAPVGPLRGDVPAKAGDSAVPEQLAQAEAAADLMITLATLDPAVGGDHLRTWAATAVAVVTAGGATSEGIRGVGDMVRTSGIQLDSAVLVGADSSDTSLGLGTAE